MNGQKLCWLDIRGAGAARPAIIEEALHQRIDGVVAGDLQTLADLPPTVRKVLLPSGEGWWRDECFPGAADIVVLPPGFTGRAELEQAHPEVEFGRLVEITDAASLEEACTAARTERWSVLDFRDPTKIPLEIVIAAAAGSKGAIVTTAADPEEAAITFGVLELGSDGVMMPGRSVGDATALVAAARSSAGELTLTELTVTATTHIGMGERACVDTCSQLREDEGMLVGSYSKGMVLCVSETHPLPYMPTRPFRVNAGAVHSYVVAPHGRTNYLSELHAGAPVLAVDATGRTRVVPVGRVKIETRPLISVDAVSPEGQQVNLILQDDWHVRVLGPGGVVLNCTELAPGDKLLGYVPTADRHVGYPIDEFCREQ
ncbi:3-dehydroquinate synthase II family protein [Streptomyces sp. NPDC056194]|uniref:3-dehydroquinate synthase II family protein n=1 Tax=unclassified Streptomyces TaxID=2593676 RepID=UPI0035DFACAA